ncbi:MAG TPA: hypothetical protein DCM71_04140 [Runella sp.]|nr:hypothetical protein [Runella sp.]
MTERSLFIKLVQKYGSSHVIWKEEPKDGIEFLKQNLNLRTIVILDYDFGTKSNCIDIFQEIQSQSSLIYIILNTAKDISEIKESDLKIFINNHLMALVDKSDYDGYQKTLIEVEKAIGYLNNRVDCILEEWILRHEMFTREQPYIKDSTGKIISLNDILKDIRQDTDFGRKMSSNIIRTAISMLQKDIDKMDIKSNTK